MTRLLDKILLVFQGILILFLLPGLAAPYVNPEFVTFPAFSGLLFPYITILLIILGIYGVFRRLWGFIPTLVVLILSTGGFTKIFAFNTNKTPQVADTASLSVMSYNVQGFGRYQDDSVVDKFLNLFKREQPDILCLQEFYAREGAFENNLSQVIQAGSYPYRYCNTVGYKGRGNFFGLVIFTKHPIVNQGYLEFKGQKANGSIYADFVWQNDTFRMFNIHLQSTHLFKKSRLDRPNNGHSLLSNIDGKLGRLKKGFIKRASQSKKVADAVEDSPHPVILCGDLNDTPLSYTYHTMIRELDDAFISAANGLGRTYTNRYGFLRIDYILYNDVFNPVDFSVLKADWSDHFPVHCTFKLRNTDL